MSLSWFSSSIRTTPTSPLPTPLELPEHTGINDHPINLAFQVAQLFVSALMLFIHRMVAFDCVSEANHQEPLSVVFDQGSTLLIKLLIPTEGGLLPMVRQV